MGRQTWNDRRKLAKARQAAEEARLADAVDGVSDGVVHRAASL
jgi:hypothetical protein